ncbi:MAG: GrpB family protein [Alphaproteobacteria bacterium]|nr:GrpB family protein [Alphaproteobacteria bacterium]
MSDKRPVVLVAHDPAWTNRAAHERMRIVEALGDMIVAVHHIGSTSIPGILTKPIIDLMPIVRSLELFDAQEGVVRGLGYEWRGEFGIVGRRFCTLNDASGKRVVHVHFFAPDSDEIEPNLAFRDYLRAHRDEALAYQAEKLRAAALHPDDSGAYTEEKGAWIRACKARAVAWARR